MNPSAHVTATEPLVHFQGDLASFSHEAKEALLAVEMEIQRAEGFIDDQLKYWQAYVRKAEDRVFQAKSELARRKMMRIGDRPLDCTEQEEALQKAEARLEYAEEKLAATKRWAREWPEAVREYLGPARQLTSVLEIDLPRMQVFLNQKIAALEAYAQVALAPPKES
jgi:hypothetical protein